MHRILQRHGPVLLLLALLTVSLLAITARAQRAATGGEIGAPLDDAWIHLQFARNLRTGQGFSYNPGDPTPGSTAPLWTLLLAGAAFVTDDLLPAALFLSAAMLLLTVWLTYAVAYTSLSSRWAAALAAALVPLTGRMLWAGWSGMEITLFATLLLAGLWAYLRVGLRWWVAALFGVATQLRPEAYALFGLLGLLWAAETARARAASRRQLIASARHGVVALLAFLLPALPYTLFALSTTGKPLPNTFYAKTSSDVLFSVRTLTETLIYHWRDNPAAGLLLLLGLPLMWRRARPVAIWLSIMPFAIALTIDATFHHGRYTMPLIPLQLIAGVGGLYWISRRVARWEKMAALVGAIGLLVAGAWGVPRWIEMVAVNTREIQAIDVALGHWLAENTPPEALIAVDDIGAIAYLSGREVYDLNGLVTPDVWPALAEGFGRGRNEAELRIMADRRPTHLAVFPLWHFETAMNPLVATPLARFTTNTNTIIGEQEAVVYALELPYLTSATPSVPVDALLGERIALLGYDLVQNASAAEITLYWKSIEPVAVSYDVFVHVLSADGMIITQSDGKPVGALAPTTRWRAGDIVRDPHILPLVDLASGAYRVQVGLYRRDDFSRLPVAGSDAAGPDAVRLENLIIAP